MEKLLQDMIESYTNIFETEQFVKALPEIYVLLEGFIEMYKITPNANRIERFLTNIIEQNKDRDTIKQKFKDYPETVKLLLLIIDKW